MIPIFVYLGLMLAAGIFAAAARYVHIFNAAFIILTPLVLLYLMGLGVWAHG